MKQSEIRIDPLTSNDVKNNRKKFLWLSILFIAVTLLAIPFDISIAQFFRAKRLPGELRTLVSFAEVFAHGLGVAAVLAVIFVGMEQRRRILRVIMCAAVPGIIASFAKVIVGRQRPNSLKDLPDHVSESFVGFFPAFTQHAGEVGKLFDRAVQSFPSGHSAVAVGLAIGLSWLFPRARFCFYLIATLAICQRLDSGAHYLSDTLASTALAIFIASRYVANHHWESQWLTRFETSEPDLAVVESATNESDSQHAA